MNMRVLFTGGGTAGHITPNLAVISALKNEYPKIKVFYIGSYHGLETKIVPAKGIIFKSVCTGKLRRYFSIQNFFDLFLIPIGTIQSIYYIIKFKPELIFSKGGYVSIPVVIAGWILRKKIILHESDLSPGLANKILIYFSERILVPQKQTINHLPKNKRDKAIICGSPIRQELYNGDEKIGYEFCKLDKQKKVLLVMGGSSGANYLNKLVNDNLEDLLKITQIIHICGKGKIEKKHYFKGYYQIEYVEKELKDIYKITDLIVSRAGANSIAEFNAMGIPSILIPLPKASSRGDQIENALYNQKIGGSIVLKQEKLKNEDFRNVIKDVFSSNKQLGNMRKSIKKSHKDPLVIIINNIKLCLD